MFLQKRPFYGAGDLPAIMALAIQAPIEQFSVTALPYQLSSWALDAPENVGLWEGASGNLVAFALLQIPFASLIYMIHPRMDTEQAEDRILAWAVERGQALARTQNEPFSFLVLLPPTHQRLIARLESQGFQRQEPGRTLLHQPITGLPMPPILPVGFRLRHLQGEAEVAEAAALLGAAFNITTVTTEWRRRITQQPHYRPELDIVVEAPDGRLAAFCLWWLHPNGRTAQIEPMGTHPDFQRLGLGRAALLEGLRRVQQLGATTALVGTSAGNFRSQALYRSVGFQFHHEKLVYRRTFGI